MVSDRLQEAYVPDALSTEDLTYYEEVGFGNRMGWGDAPAVLMVDMTNQFAGEATFPFVQEHDDSLISANKRLLDTARDNGIPIFYTRGMDEHLYNLRAYRGNFGKKFGKTEAGDTFDYGEGNAIVDELQPQPEDVVIEKPKQSAFFDTPLSSICRYFGVDTLIITGVATSGCIRATAIDALSHEFHNIFPLECIGDYNELPHQVNLFDIDMRYGDVTPLDDVITTLEENGW